MLCRYAKSHAHIGGVVAEIATLGGLIVDRDSATGVIPLQLRIHLLSHVCHLRALVHVQVLLAPTL